MIPNMKFYVISIAAIFLALGVGIYIGFILDSQELITDQREDIITDIEESFNFLSDENEELRESLELERKSNSDYELFINSTYEDIIGNRLLGTNIAIIETNDDYIYSGVGNILEIAGADVVNITTISDKLMDEELLNKFYEEFNITRIDDNIVKDSTEKLFKSIAIGETTDFVIKLNENKFVEMVGLINEPIDYIIIAGGSIEEEVEKIETVDATIIQVANEMSIPIIGIETLETIYSYMSEYNKLGITTVDNIDTTIGKVAFILAIEGRPGNYGQKDTAEELIPMLNIPPVQNVGE